MAVVKIRPSGRRQRRAYRGHQWLVSVSLSTSLWCERDLTEKEIAFFLNIDHIDHVALVAVVDEGGEPTIVGDGHYVTIEPGRPRSASR